MINYEDFIKSKVKLAVNEGFDLNIDLINPRLKPHNKLMVKWLVEGGRRACFASFGLHKTVTQLEAVRCMLEVSSNSNGLIVLPLGVRREFIEDSFNILGWNEAPKFIRHTHELSGDGIYLTNYESIRDGKLNPHKFQVASLDEASVLRGLGGSKTFREFMRLFTGDAGPMGDRRGTLTVPHRFVATATPAPNEYIELLAYADFLGVMDVAQAKTRFFKRDSTKADKLTLFSHKEEEFWLWVASWALFVTKPSDLTGNPSDDIGYELPDIDIRWHEIPSDHSTAGTEKNGQFKLFKDSALGVIEASREKRDSLDARIKKMLEIRSEDPEAHRIIWHDLEDERRAIEKALPECKTVFGSQDLDKRENIIAEFSNGELQEIGGKPVMIGSGTNLQKFCSWSIYLGIGYKFNDFIQSIHRLQRFLQRNKVRVDLIYTSAEINVRKKLETSWTQHNKMVKKMTDIIKQYGLSHAAMANALSRKMGIERVEVKGERFTAVNNDCVLETKSMVSDSIGLILSSFPFSTQYEYSPNYYDFGHSDSNEEFLLQCDYLTPELYRTLKPGRLCVIHVKDRIVPSGLTGLGFQTVYPFHLDIINHFRKHGFAYIGMKTIVTDVVRENSQTYRLGWSEQCKDGTKMGVGMPEYLLYFRKPPTDTSNSYADQPVEKQKPDCIDNVGNVIPWRKDAKEIPGTGYSRARWQMDAHGYTRSAGDRLLDPNEIKTLDHDVIFKLFRDYSLSEIWDFEQVVKIAESLVLHGKLPTSFMLLQPQSWSPDVWTDITRMRTLNGSQWSKGKELHICPFQFDIVDRVINQCSNEGDVIYDPFAGLFTVPYRAIKFNRIGIGCELNPTSFFDGVAYCKAEEESKSVPSLFSLEDFQ